MIRTRHGIVVVLFALAAASMVVDCEFSAAQDAPAKSASGKVDLVEVPTPDLSSVDPRVGEQIHAAQAALAAATEQAAAPRVRRADAFGKLGQVYQAYGFENAALGCYTNASRLDPQSFRWSYYAGYLGQSYGDAETSERDYQKALALRPNDIRALLRLGNLELTLAHPDAAKRYFTRAAAQRISSASALTGLGKVALAERQYSVAVKYFTQALTHEPQASSIHYQLAMAYRGLGDAAHMQEQLKARGDVEPTIPDSLLDEINVLKQGKFGLLERAKTAMRDNHFAAAAADCRQAISLDPSDPIIYKYLGFALAKSNQPGEARKEYAHSLELDPNNATVHYNLGILLIEEKQEEQATHHFQEATRLDPGLVAAHFQLANLLMRKKQDADAEREYGVVISLEPQNAFARFMQAMAAIHSRSYARARKQLEDAAEASPGDADIANALARLLAAAPDPAVRDQERALRIVESLVNRRQGDPLEVGITLAMALAATGRFQEAARYQEAIIKQLEASGQHDIALPLQQDLARYQQSKPCLTPWNSNDPVFTPVPSMAQLPLEANMMAARE